jgi:hypothetical protein
VNYACRLKLSIRLVPEHHSWVGLPQSVVNHYLQQNLPIQAIFRLVCQGESGRDVLVAWNGLTCGGNECIEVPRALALACGLREGDVVVPEPVTNLPHASMVHVTAASLDDWEVMEVNAEHLTQALLQQLKVVRKGDTLPIWIRGQSSVTVKVEAVSPADIAVLQNDSIVSIQPP